LLGSHPEAVEAARQSIGGAIFKINGDEIEVMG